MAGRGPWLRCAPSSAGRTPLPPRPKQLQICLFPMIDPSQARSSSTTSCTEIQALPLPVPLVAGSPASSPCNLTLEPRLLCISLATVTRSNPHCRTEKTRANPAVPSYMCCCSLACRSLPAGEEVGKLSPQGPSCCSHGGGPGGEIASAEPVKPGKFPEGRGHRHRQLRARL